MFLKLLKRNKSLLFVIILFICSIYLRLPHLNRHLSDSHEWGTATSMIALENLNVQGALKHKFCIIQTYPREADKYIQNQGFHFFNYEGYGYYTSFPLFQLFCLFSFLKGCILTSMS